MFHDTLCAPHVGRPHRADVRSSNRTEERAAEVCLIDALRSLGVPLQCTDSGPFWALRDGNRMLMPRKPLSTECVSVC